MNKLRFFFLLGIIALLFLVVLFVSVKIGAQNRLAGLHSQKPLVSFEVTKGEGFLEIGDHLKQQGLIRSDFVFKAYALLSGTANRLKAGTYEFSPSMSIEEIVLKLSRGEISKNNITIIEGWNLNDIAWYLENKGMFQAEELFELVGFPHIDYRNNNDLPPLQDFVSKYDFLSDKPKYISLEGYLFPDTYEINKEDNLNNIVDKMLDNFQEKIVNRFGSDIQRQGKSIFDVVTMASIIEKEVRNPEDKSIVSGILWKRLDARMPLQVDATVNYVTGRKDSGPSASEKKIDSLYNTYKHKGLPLGPISNPGLDSVEAALDPKDSDFWYYISTPEGKTIFSKTLKEHNAAIDEYLR